jgi:hypothetical protein
MQPIRPRLNDGGKLCLGGEAAQAAEFRRPGPARFRVHRVTLMEDRVPKPDPGMAPQAIQPFQLLVVRMT